MNDSLKDDPITLRVLAEAQDGAVLHRDTRVFHLPAGEQTRTSIAFPAPAKAGDGPIMFHYDLFRHGKPVDVNVRELRIFRRRRFDTASSLVYLASDPAVARLMKNVNGRTRGIANLAALVDCGGSKLVLRETAAMPPRDVASMRSFLRLGGTVIYLGSDPTVAASPRWLDIQFVFPTKTGRRMFQPYCVAFKDPAARDAISANIVDTDLLSPGPNETVPYGDLRFWGEDNFIAAKSIALAGKKKLRDMQSLTPIVRATDGKAMIEPMRNVLLARIAQGRGTVWYATLLLLEKYETAPPAAKILGLLLE